MRLSYERWNSNPAAGVRAGLRTVRCIVVSANGSASNHRERHPVEAPASSTCFDTYTEFYYVEGGVIYSKQVDIFR